MASYLTNLANLTQLPRIGPQLPPSALASTLDGALTAASIGYNATIIPTVVATAAAAGPIITTLAGAAIFGTAYLAVREYSDNEDDLPVALVKTVALVALAAIALVGVAFLSQGTGLGLTAITAAIQTPEFQESAGKILMSGLVWAGISYIVACDSEDSEESSALKAAKHFAMPAARILMTGAGAPAVAMTIGGAVLTKFATNIGQEILF